MENSLPLAAILPYAIPALSWVVFLAMVYFIFNLWLDGVIDRLRLRRKQNRQRKQRQQAAPAAPPPAPPVAPATQPHGALSVDQPELRATNRARAAHSQARRREQQQLRDKERGR